MTAPLGATPSDLTRLGEADFNVVLYPEIAVPAAQWLEKAHGQPFTRIAPLGVGATREFIAEAARLAGVDPTAVLAEETSRLPWYSRSVNSTYLTGKRVFIFGDATHVIAAARIAQNELGFQVVGLGTYTREFAREVREAAKIYDVEALITDDYLEVEARVAELQPELVLGTQMERHIAKRLGIPCAVISAPVHVQDFPARYSPQMGFEGANVIFDTWIHPLMMGLEEHLLAMFREDFEFGNGAAPSHLAVGTTAAPEPIQVDAHRQPAGKAQRRDEIQIPTSEAEDAFAWTAGRRKGAEQNSVLRARQGPPQYRALRDRARRGAQSPSRRSTMQKPTSRAEATPVRVVIVTMDPHVASATDRARETLARQIPGAQTACPRGRRSGLRRSDGIGAVPRRYRRRPHRHQHDAVPRRPFSASAAGARGPARRLRRDGVRMSAGEVIKLTRIGRFDMSARGAAARWLC